MPRVAIPSELREDAFEIERRDRPETNQLMIKHGLCATTSADPAIFFPALEENDQFRKSTSYYQAKAICAVCPVRIECLSYGMAHWALHAEGIWGGRDQRERKQILWHIQGRRKRQLAAARPLISPSLK